MSLGAEGKGERGLGRFTWINSLMDNCLVVCFTLFVSLCLIFFFAFGIPRKDGEYGDVLGLIFGICGIELVISCSIFPYLS